MSKHNWVSNGFGQYCSRCHASRNLEGKQKRCEYPRGTIDSGEQELGKNKKWMRRLRLLIRTKWASKKKRYW